jgi:hypothetical protein
LSIREISRELGIAGSTLYLWIADLKRSKLITKEDQLEHLRRIRNLAQQAIKKKRETRLNEIKNEILKEIEEFDLTKIFVLKSILTMFYWEEGGKTRGTVDFANTYPKLSFLFITLLRKCYLIDENKLRVRLHLHYYHKIKECRKFWSGLLGISEAKFGKIYIKPRSKTKKFRQNFAGICFIRYHDENLRLKILETAFALGDKITSQVPVA